MMHQSQVIAVVLALFYAGCMAVSIIMVYHRTCVNSHAVLSIFGTTLIGFAMIAFRMLRGQQTRFVKYFHLVVHITAVIALVYGLVIAIVKPTAREQIQVVHKYPSIVVLSALLVQIIAAMAFFLSITNARVRLGFAPMHDIAGIWLFLCLAGCCISGSVPIAEFQSVTWILTFFICFVCGVLIVLSVVLSPYFEWELRGNL